jgi:predicted ferric reductase
VAGLVLGLGWRSQGWPRFLKREAHQFAMVLALVFTALHGLALWLDPFMKFGLNELLVPLAGHYRPLWMALGIVAAYLLAAIFLTEYLRLLIGFDWWRRLHQLTFAAYVLASAHGLTTGSDARTGWSFVLYAGSAAAVLTLVVCRLVESKRLGIAARTALGIAAVCFAVIAWALVAAGPLQPGWNAIANNGHGSGSRLGSTSVTTPAP